MSGDDSRIPVFLLTGFLGSGKTTLLNDILAAPDLQDTAVVINEFGEVGIDHLIVGTIDGETVLLRNGCVCCALRDDLKETLQGLHGQMARGDVPPFRRVVVETTGLADPVPILHTLIADPMLRHQFRHAQTIVTVDAVHGAGQLARHAESVRQAAVADRLVLTKADIASDGQAEATRRAVRRVNAGAPLEVRDPGGAIADLLAVPDGAAETALRDTAAWLAGFGALAPAHDYDDRDHGHAHGHHAHAHDHDVRVRSLSLSLDERLDWTAFGVWLSALLHRHGERILRVKGILDVSDVEGPVVLQAVESLTHPPVHLPAWPPGPRGSRLVFITKDLDPEAIRRSLHVFLAAAASRSDAGEAAA